MQISSRFTLALHILTCAELFGRERRVTSEFLSQSVNTNPVIVRRILSQLKAAGLITVARGTGGVALTRPGSEISFLDVFRAIEPMEGGELFRFHENPNPACPVGRNIHTLLDGRLGAIQSAMEQEMSRSTLAGLCAGAEELIGRETPPSPAAEDEKRGMK